MNQIDKLLNEMAPFKKLTTKEIGLKQTPWITSGLLVSMKERDHLHQLYIKEKNKELKAHYHSLYKNKRNLILTLQRASKKEYFSDFFLENQANIKKTWEGIRNLLNVSKKSSSTLSKIINNDQILNKNSDISKKMNIFLCECWESN